MARIEVFGSTEVLARNAWNKINKNRVAPGKEYYIRSPQPWAFQRFGGGHLSAAQQSVNKIFTYVRKKCASYTVDDAVEIVGQTMREVYRRMHAGQGVSQGDLDGIISRVIAAVTPVAAKIPGSERAAIASRARGPTGSLSATLAAQLSVV